MSSTTPGLDTYNLLVRVLRIEREIWQGSEEAPAVRSVARRLAFELAHEFPAFSESQFLKDVGY